MCPRLRWDPNREPGSNLKYSKLEYAITGFTVVACHHHRLAGSAVSTRYGTR